MHFAARVVSLLLLLLLAPQTLTNAVPNASALLGGPLPFAAQPQSFSLSASLFAGGGATANNDDNALAAAPFPTGAFWTNLVLENGEAAVATLPYALRVRRDGRVHVSHPFRVVMPTIIQNGFLTQLVLSSTSAAAADDENEQLTHQVVAFDEFSATLRFSRRQQEEFTLLLVRGSPYLTAEYTNSRPVLEGFEGITIQRVRKLEDQILSSGDPVDFAVFLVLLNNGQTWAVYASDPALELSLMNGRITSDVPFTGTLRVALSGSASALPLLLDAAPFYPVGGEVDYTVDAEASVAHLQFKWKTRRFASNDSGFVDSDRLLMLALPHHVDILAKQESDTGMATTVNKVADELLYTSIKGMMTGVYGSVWHLRETLPDVAWDFVDDGLFSKNASKGASEQDAALRLAMRDKVVEKIVTQLAKDVDAYPALAVDSYNFGKQIAREARLLLIADRFKQQALVDKVLHKMKTELEAWLAGTNADYLVYDQTFGGLVTRNGIHDKDADFGNGRYNDHHFHYGYFVYALAAVRKFDPAFISAHSLACAMLLGDIGTPVLKHTPFFADLPTHKLFPVARHKEWFVGHSYASGLFSMEVGKSQESSSESVNAYYALALFSSLDADAGEATSYHQYARLLLATEIRSTKKYWHMQKNSQIYESLFAKNTMVGVAGEMSVVYSTWFGDKAVYIHGINMIPFTPISAQLLNEEYIAYEYALLRQDFQDLAWNDIWRSVVVLDHAILDAATAWDELVSSVSAYDTWNSAANSMYWIATRPSWFAQKSRTTLTKPDMHKEDKCFGYPECSTAGANGTALGCCSTLPGCCPSALGCCPKRDAAAIPLNACFGEHQCAILGVGCCNSIDGCCEPDPITGVVLGCCKNQHPATKNPRTTPPHSNQTSSSVCFDQPLCAAAKLDCCASPTGCCSNDGPKLDCCRVPPATASTMKTKNETDDDAETCHHQPKCAAAKLDCCGDPKGCCQPDPITGAKLLCCEDDDDATPVTPTTPAPTPSVPDYGRTCHGELACLTGGENGAALDCCFTEKGCCPGLLCCSAPSDDGDEDEVHTKTGSDGDKDGKDSSRVSLVFAIILGVFLVGAIAFCLAMCYRRRHYAPIDHDLRAWYCAAMVVIVMGFFVFLVYSA